MLLNESFADADSGSTFAKTVYFSSNRQMHSQNLSLANMTMMRLPGHCWTISCYQEIFSSIDTYTDLPILLKVSFIDCGPTLMKWCFLFGSEDTHPKPIPS